MPSARRLGRSMRLAGFDARSMWRAARYAPHFARDWRTYRRAAGPVALLPILTDYGDQAGDVESEYFLADLWMARRICDHDARRHVDVGSRIDGLVAHLLTFRDVEVIDVRPLQANVPGLTFVQGDAMSLDGLDDRSLPSLSSVHAVEHFGLGRYGEPIDVHGHERGMAALARVGGGRVFFGVPVGRPRVEFNAHRILDPCHPVEAFRNYELVEFAAVVPGEGICEKIEPRSLADVDYAVGLYVFERR